MNENNNYEKGKENLESREFNTDSSKSDSTQDIKVTSLGKVAGFSDEPDEPTILPGYIEIFSSEFPSRGLFYPNNMRFFIRSASVKEIRHFSTIDDTDPYMIDEALNEIVKGCLMIKQPGKLCSFKDLCEEDRFYVILNIRDLTFVDGENKLVINAKCGECSHDNQIEIKNDSFRPTEPSESVMKYYNDELRIFEIETRSSGVFKMRPPSIGVMMNVTKYIRRSQESGKRIDPSFIKCLPYMETDWRNLNESVLESKEIEFMRWDSKKYQVFNKLTEMVKVGVEENLYSTCEKCESEVRTKISFPDGIKSLFVISDISGELL